MADINNYMPGPRHAPRPEIAAPNLERRKPVASFTNPAGTTQEFVGTGSVTNAAGRGNRKRSGGTGYGAASGSAPVGPLSGLADAQDQIIRASGLGRRAPDGPTVGEQMSDADGPTQDVGADADGNLVHNRRNPSGNVTQTPLGSYSTGSYGTAPSYFED